LAAGKGKRPSSAADGAAEKKTEVYPVKCVSEEGRGKTGRLAATTKGGKTPNKKKKKLATTSSPVERRSCFPSKGKRFHMLKKESLRGGKTGGSPSKRKLLQKKRTSLREQNNSGKGCSFARKKSGLASSFNQGNRASGDWLIFFAFSKEDTPSNPRLP